MPRKRVLKKKRKTGPRVRVTGCLINFGPGCGKYEALATFSGCGGMNGTHPACLHYHATRAEAKACGDESIRKMGEALDRYREEHPE